MKRIDYFELFASLFTFKLIYDKKGNEVPYYEPVDNDGEVERIFVYET